MAKSPDAAHEIEHNAIEAQQAAQEAAGVAQVRHTTIISQSAVILSSSLYTGTRNCADWRINGG